MSTKWLERTYLNREASAARGGQPASLAGASGAHARAEACGTESFVIEMNDRRVKLTVPLDIVESLTGGARVRGANRPTQPLRGAGAHGAGQSRRQEDDGERPGVIASPMQAVVTRVNVAEGQRVAKGDLIVVLESMKMENYVYAPAAGVVSKIFVGAASGVEAGDTLVTLDVAEHEGKASDGARPEAMPDGGASDGGKEDVR